MSEQGVEGGLALVMAEDALPFEQRQLQRVAVERAVVEAVQSHQLIQPVKFQREQQPLAFERVLCVHCRGDGLRHGGVVLVR